MPIVDGRGLCVVYAEVTMEILIICAMVLNITSILLLLNDDDDDDD